MIEENVRDMIAVEDIKKKKKNVRLYNKILLLLKWPFVKERL